MFNRLGNIPLHMKRASLFIAATGGLTLLAVPSSSKCSGEDHIPSLDYGWPHHGALSSFDYASIRRGFQVKKKKIKINRVCIF